jgi:hypothetical protein
VYNQTTLHPIGLVAVIVLGLATLAVPRRYALVPFLIMACFISPAQRIVFATLDFNLLRLLVLFGWARVAITGEARGFKWKSIDTLLVLWTLSGTAILTLREATFSGFIYRLGVMYDAFGLYFLFRFMIRGWSDVEAIITSAAVISVPVAAVFCLEQATGRNMFAIFGGVAETTLVRNGLLRCRGPFAHPILAGCFWAALMPMIGALWWNGRPTRWLAPVGVAASVVVIVTTSSATSFGALAVVVFAAALFPLRRYVGWMRWAALLGLLGLHLAMINPVWHLLARIRLVGGTGWYRYKLIDEFVNRFDEWWLLGTNSYEAWWQYSFAAVTNQYVLEGVQGGLLTLGLFVAIIAVAFHGVGRMGRSVSPDRFRQLAAWAVGVSLLVHCAAFIAVAYFGQIFVVWYMGLSIVGSLLPAATGRRVYRIATTRSAGGQAMPIAPPGPPAPVGA